MANITKSERLNRELRSYRFFDTKEQAEKFIRLHRLENPVLSSNAAGTCWTLYHKNLWKI